jgi:hypothetical protein
MTKIAELYGVTDNAIKHRLKKYGIVYPYYKGYWGNEGYKYSREKSQEIEEYHSSPP